MAKHTKMTPEAASRVQSSTAKKNNGKVEKGGFASRAQSSGAKNENSKQSSSKSKTNNKSTGK